MIRPACPDDAPWLAQVHARARRETYAGLLPPEAVDDVPPHARLTRWRAILAAGTSRVVVLPRAGFASTGPQRDAALADRFPREVYAIYLLRAAQGRGDGRALLRAAWTGAPATVALVTGNRAEGFYRASGARVLTRDADETVMAWDADPWPDGAPTDRDPDQAPLRSTSGYPI